VWDGKNDASQSVTSGIYVYALKAGPSTGLRQAQSGRSVQGFVAKKKFVLIK